MSHELTLLADLIEEIYGNRVRSFIRYATKKGTLFDREYLEGLVDSLPEGFEVTSINRSLYEACLAEAWSQDLVGNYIDFEQFWNWAWVS